MAPHECSVYREVVINHMKQHYFSLHPCAVTTWNSALSPARTAPVFLFRYLSLADEATDST